MSQKQFFVLAAGVALGWLMGFPAFWVSFPGSRATLGVYAVSGVILLALAVTSWLSERPSRFVSRWLRPVWRRDWLRYILAALWLVAAFWFFRNYRLALFTDRTVSNLAFLGFGLWTTAGLALCLGPGLSQDRAFSNQGAANLLSLLIVAGWITFGFYLWGENLRAGWWIIDDHETLRLIGSGASPLERLFQFPNLWGYGEVVPFASPRFRPIFWIFQSLEGVVWGAQPLLWYLFRTGVFILACTVCYRLLKPLLGTLNSILFTLLLASFSFWSDIFTRLGPAENYALLGLTGYALASVSLLRHYREDAPAPSRRVYAAWVLFGASSIIAMGAKENFVWLLLANAALFGYLIFKRRRSIFGMAVLALSTGFGLLSLATVFFTNTIRGFDVYGNSGGLSDRFATTFAAVQRNVISLPALAALGGLLMVLGIGTVVLYRAGDREGLARLGKGVLLSALVAGGLAAVYVSQLYFYNGALPTNTRYDLPGVLIPPFVGLIGVVLILLIVRLTVKQPYYDMLVALVPAVCLGGILLATGFDNARQASHANVERTRQFDAALSQIQLVALANPQVALVLDTHSGLDYEASYSVVRFLRRRGVENPIFLRYSGTGQPDATNPLEKILAQRIYELAQGKQTSDAYRPFQDFADRRCFGISFSGETEPPCEHVMRIWR